MRMKTGKLKMKHSKKFNFEILNLRFILKLQTPPALVETVISIMDHCTKLVHQHHLGRSILLAVIAQVPHEHPEFIPKGFSR